MTKLVIGENDLISWCKKNNKETLLSEWDYSANNLKNNNRKTILSPNSVTPYSSIKVGWICEKGHRYEATVRDRTANNHGCPFCSGRKLLRGYNDFETWCKSNNREDLLKEWNDKKNNGLKPCDIIQGGGNKKYWWTGACGHEWDAVISSRITTRKGKKQLVKTAGCPYCSNPPKRIMVGFNDLESWCKKNQKEFIIREWDYEKNTILPTEVTFGSGKNVWWKCNKNHEWRTQIHSRTGGRGTYCPICARTQSSFPEQAVAFYLRNDFEVLQRHKIKGLEVDIFLPQFRIGIEYDGFMWHSGKEKRDLEKTRKLVLEGIRVIRLRETKKNTSTYEMDGQTVIEFIGMNGKYVTNEFERALSELYKVINSITNKKINPNIDIKRDELLVRAYYMNALKANSVASVFPELVKEWDIEKNEGITPEVYSARNNKKIWWKCKNGHSWMASINSRGENKRGCPYCAGQRVVAGKNDFELWCRNNNSKLLDEWDYGKNTMKPYEIPKTYKGKVYWKCLRGHEWEATAYNRVNGTGCPICNVGNNAKRKKVTLYEWCIENNSNLCDEWNYKKNINITPKTITNGSHAKVWWKCSKGHEWEAQVKSRTYNHGCPYCSGTNKKATKGINDLETWCKKNDREDILEEWDLLKNGNLTPDMITWGSHKRIHWRCIKGHTWEAVVKERTKIHGNRCPICRKE